MVAEPRSQYKGDLFGTSSCVCPSKAPDWGLAEEPGPTEGGKSSASFKTH